MKNGIKSTQELIMHLFKKKIQLKIKMISTIKIQIYYLIITIIYFLKI